MAYTNSDQQSRTFHILIVGNPNSGKSAIFNSLTHKYQDVGNYPGVTVERKRGKIEIENLKFTIEDLPGAYSLTPYSEDEKITRDLILNTQNYDLILNVLDSTNLERNLYLTTELMELKKPMVIVLNMTDLAAKRGIYIDEKQLSKLLSVPVVKTIGNKGEGIDEIKKLLSEYACNPGRFIPTEVSYGHEVETIVEHVAQKISEILPQNEIHRARWYAVKLLEKDSETSNILTQLLTQSQTELLKKISNEAISEIEKHEKEDSVVTITQRRYGYVSGIIRQSVRFYGEAVQNITNQIDNIICNKIAGPIILIFIVATIFLIVFKTTQEWQWIPSPIGWLSPLEVFEELFGFLGKQLEKFLHSTPMLLSLLKDGIVGGVGAVLSFVPLIFVLFFVISYLEDTGYVARIAFILDRLMRTFGLQGRSILALLISGGIGAGGCAVPGVLATRTIQQKRDRIITILVVPFMSCGAKLPVYAVLISAFFEKYRTTIMLSLWVISWLVALICAFILSRTIFKGEYVPFVLELPPYHIPVIKSVLRQAWGRTWQYIKKAGTLILAINIVMWALIYIPVTADKSEEEKVGKVNLPNVEASIGGYIGKKLEILTHPIGFNWKINVALLGGIAAKEVIVGTLGTVYSVETSNNETVSLSKAISQSNEWSPLIAYTLMVFVMLYAPCTATLITIWKETKSIYLPLLSLTFSTTVAYITALIVFQFGNLLSFGTQTI